MGVNNKAEVRRAVKTGENSFTFSFLSELCIKPVWITVGIFHPEVFLQLGNEVRRFSVVRPDLFFVLFLKDVSFCLFRISKFRIGNRQLI